MVLLLFQYIYAEIDDTTVSQFVCTFALDMNDLIVKKVTTKREMDDFVRLPSRLYRDCPQYVPDMERDIRDMFDPRKNAGLGFCEVQPFVAYYWSTPVGRIVGIINHRANRKWERRCVRFGLIEFIDHSEVSQALLSAVEQWGYQRGMDCIQGPLGITDFDKEGMLVEDFDLVGAMTSIYNHAYYPQHMEALGYQKAADWIQFRLQVPEQLPARFERVAQLSKEMFGLRVRTMTRKDVRGGYAQQAFDLFNQCYSQLFGFTEFTPEQTEEFIRQYQPLVDLRLVPVVENKEGEIVGIAVTMVSLVEALQKSHGRLWPLGWWHLLKALKWQRADHVEMLLVAVRPDYQGLGVNALFFEYLLPVYHEYGIRWAETGPQLEDNIKALSQWKAFSPETVKRRRCYEKKL